MADPTLPDCSVDSLFGGPYEFDRNLHSGDLAPILTAAASLIPGTPIPYLASKQFLDKGQAAASPNFKMDLPGGTSLDIPAMPGANNMLEMLAPLINVLSMTMVVFGPIKIITGILVGIVNVLCAIPNPFKMQEELAKLMLLLVPLLGLLPPAAAILLILDLVKALLAILAALIIEVLPKIDMIIENAQRIIDEMKDGNLSSASAGVKKICEIVKVIINDFAILAPVNSLLDMISLFSSFGSAGICGPGDTGQDGSNCCDPCPPLLTAPPYSNDVSMIGLGSVAQLNQAVTVTQLTLDGMFFSSGAAAPASAVANTAWPRNFYTRPTTATSSSSDLGQYLTDLDFYNSANSNCLFAKISGTDSRGRAVKAETLKISSFIPAGETGQVILTLETPISRLFSSISKVEIIPNVAILMQNGFLSNGCTDTVANSRSDLEDERQSTRAAREAIGVAGALASSKLSDQLGIEIPRLDIEKLRGLANDLLDNPETASPDPISDAITAEIVKFSDLGGRAICLLADPVQSGFEVSTQTADIKSPILVQLQVRDRNGNAILAGMPSSIQASAVFTSTLGTFTPVNFNSDTGTFFSYLSSESVGSGIIGVYFLTTTLCMIPRFLANPSAPAKTISIQFIDGALKPRRQNRQYVQAIGGRRH